MLKSPVSAQTIKRKGNNVAQYSLEDVLYNDEDKSAVDNANYRSNSNLMMNGSE